ncbi:alpha/beta hydrolase [Planococcus sp. 1R117A]|uniref:alpha/beta hydrolase n=1 Tax=Planococcus sp. 1R117A TaxID=3447020 RepID=UPI003EDBC2FB
MEVKKQVLFIHSAGPQGFNQGSSGLIRFLEKELDGDFELIHPEMPDPENPVYTEWKDQLAFEFTKLREGAILAGHSLGGSALLKFLSEEPVKGPFPALFLVASPVWGLEKYWEKEDFTLTDDFATKLPEISRIILFHSTGDSIVPYTHLEKYTELLPSAAVKSLPGDSHLFEKGLKELSEEMKSL